MKPGLRYLRIHGGLVLPMVICFLHGHVCATDDGSVVDLMVVYTPAARTVANATYEAEGRAAPAGMPEIEDLINHAIDETNQIFQNSRVNPQIRLVHCQELPYTEADPQIHPYPDDIDFIYLTTNQEGYLDEVFALRDTYGADTVAFVNCRGGGKGGISGSFFLVGVFNLMWWHPGHGYTFEHELGHTFGCHHAAGDSWDGNPPGLQQGQGGAYTFSHGWNLDVQGSRKCTVMAYTNPTAWLHPTWGENIPYFSNPDVLYQGVPTGSPIGATDEANNAETINRTARDVAGRKPSVRGPLAPAMVRASDMEYRDRVTVEWSVVPEATHYRVYRSMTPGGNPEGVSAWQTETTFDDTTAIPWVTHYYRVKAAKSSQGSLPSDYSEVATGARPFSPPIGVWASDGLYTDRIVVFWQRVPGDNRHYRVYRSEDPAGAKIPISDWQVDVSYTDTTPWPQRLYYYWVQVARDPLGHAASEFNESDSGWRRMVPPTATASQGTYTDRVEVSWTASLGALYYQVYRSSFLLGAKTAISGWQAATSFQDTTAIPGRDYYYFLAAATSTFGFDATDFSTAAAGWRQIEVPTGVRASDDEYSDKVLVTWNPPPGGLFYQVHYSVYPIISEMAPLSQWQTDTHYEADVPPGITYYFTVKAAAKITGDRSTALSASDGGRRRFTAPEQVEATQGIYLNRILVNWDAVPGADYYCVYRSTLILGQRTAVSDWQTERSYEDRDVTIGTNYYYWVQAAADGAGGAASQFSSVACGSTGIIPPKTVWATDGTDPDKVIVTWNRFSGTLYYQVSQSSSLDGEKFPISGWLFQGTQFEDTTIPTGTIRYYWARVSETATGSEPSAYSLPDIGYRSLPAPTGVKASEGTYESRVLIEWNPVEGATNYQVSRAESLKGDKTVLKLWQTGTTFEDSKLTPGQIYYYFVKAAGSSTGIGSGNYSSAATGFCAFPPPATVKAGNGESPDRVRISWTSTSGANYYQVLRSETLDGKKKQLTAYEQMTVYDDTDAEPGTVYCYWVRAALAANGYGATDFSPADQGWISLPAPSCPLVSDGTYNDKIVVSWEPVAEGAYYRVFRASRVDGERVPLGIWSAVTIYEDFQVQQGPNYYYWIRAASSKHEDGISDFSQAGIGCCRIPPPGEILASQGTDEDKVAVRWEKVEYAVCYQVYRATATDGEWTELSGWQAGVRYEDASALPGHVYYYSVKSARGITGYGASDLSSAATGWVRPPTPMDVSATDGGYKDRVQITWRSSLASAYYRVSRAISLDGPRKPLGDWQTQSLFDDFDTTAGLTYYYWVQTSLLAVDGGASDFSQPDTGWRTLPAPDIPSDPSPASGANDVSLSANLDWSDCDYADLYNVQLWKGQEAQSGKSGAKLMSEIPPDPSLHGLVESVADPADDLEPGTDYWWQVTACNRGGIIPGPIWHFMTAPQTDVEDWCLH